MTVQPKGAQGLQLNLSPQFEAAPRGGVNAVAFGSTSSGGSILASGGLDGTIRLWNLTAGTEPTTLTGHQRSVNSVAFGTTPDRQLLLATGSDDGTIRIWDPTVGTALNTLTGHRGWVNSVAFGTTPDRQLLLATSGNDGTIRIWDATTRTWLGTLTDHQDSVHSVAFGTTPEGQLLLATSGDDGTIRIWNPTTGTQIGQPLTGHQDWVSSIAFGTTPDSQLLLAANSGPHVLVWEVKDPPLRSDALASGDDELVDDLLGRDDLTRHLTGVLNQLVDRRGGEDHMRGTVVVNLDGRWGSGKSVLARLTTERLRAPALTKPALLRDPVVVWFNAWQQSTIGPRWWTLSAAVKKHVEQERAGMARLLLQTVSVFDRLLRSKAMLLAGAIVAVIAALTFSSLSFETWDAVGKAVAGIAAVAVIGVGLGRVLFWASPAIGKLYLSADASPLSEVSDIMSRLRRWSPRQGRPHRLADTALAVWLLLVSGWMLQRTLKEPGSVVSIPDIPLIDTLASLAWADLWAGQWVPISVGLVVLIIALSAMPRKKPPAASPPRPSTKPSLNGWRRWASIAVSMVVSVTAGTLLVLAPSLGAWTLPFGTGLILAGVGAYLFWLRKGRDTVRRPIVLVLDDLDRCSATDTVEYLETVHTLMRGGKQPRFFPRWRAPAPFIVLVLADGRWVRTAFEHHYKDFAELGDQTRQLGADFLQKLFDHTVLVPELTVDQTQKFVEHVTDSPAKVIRRASKTAAPSTIAGQPGDTSPAPQFTAPQPQGQTTPAPRDTPQAPTPASDAPSVDRERPANVTPPASVPSVQATQTLSAEMAVSEETVQLRARHLLTDYAHILPANPRLIRRVVNAWGMLDALNMHLSHREPEDIMVRAAVLMVRFPSMTDDLLGSVPPVTVARILDRNYAGPWSDPEVLAVLRDKDGNLIEPAQLGRCFGRQYRETPPELPQRSLPPQRKPARPRTRVRRRRP